MLVIMRKKLVLVGIMAAMLAGCGDGEVDAPEYVVTAQDALNRQIQNYVSLDLTCHRQQFEQRWFVMCFDRNETVGATPLFEVIKDDSRPDHYAVHPANGKASQYAEARFNENYTGYAYDDTPAEVNSWDVVKLFRDTYPPEK